MGVGHAQLLGLSIHHLDKFLHASGGVFRDGYSSIVAAAEHGAVQAGHQGQLVPLQQVQGRAVLGGGGLGGGDDLIEVGVVLDDQDGGHDLGDAGNAALSVLVLAVEDASAVHVHDAGRSGGVHRRLVDGTGGGGQPHHAHHRQHHGQQAFHRFLSHASPSVVSVSAFAAFFSAFVAFR